LSFAIRVACAEKSFPIESIPPAVPHDSCFPAAPPPAAPPAAWMSCAPVNVATLPAVSIIAT
jgi:hypothetical protein